MTAMNTPSMKAALDGPACLARHPERQYDFLPDGLNGALCGFCSSMQKMAIESIQARFALAYFSQLFFASFIILGYEAARPGNGFWTRRGLWYMMLGQVMSAAAALPLFGALAGPSRNASPLQANARPAAHKIWSVLISTLVGFYIPTARTTSTKWSHDALALWQIHPLFVIGLNFVLAPVLSLFLSRTSAVYPIYATVAVAVYLSASDHFEAIVSRTHFKDIFFPFDTQTNVVDDFHRFFVIDYAIALLALVVLVLSGPRTIGQKFGLTAAFVGISAALGPAAGVIAVWAWQELNPTVPVAVVVKKVQ